MGDPIHGEIFNDGDSSGGVAVVLYEAGSTTVRVLKATDVLYITYMAVMTEVGGVVALVADSAAAGRYLLNGTFDAKGGIATHLSKPYTCPTGKGLKLIGISTGLDTCIVEGFIKTA